MENKRNKTFDNFNIPIWITRGQYEKPRFFKNIPHRFGDEGYWVDENGGGFELPSNAFPNIEFEDEPVSAKLSICVDGKPIDNFELIEPFFMDLEKDEFMFVQILQRHKDNAELQTSHASDYRRVASFYICSVEDLRKNKRRIIQLCEDNKARAYVSVTPKNSREVALMCIEKYAQLLSNAGTVIKGDTWDSCCGQSKARRCKSVYLTDVDTKNEQILKQIINIIVTSNPNGASPEIIAKIPTPHGWHILSTGFNTALARTNIINKLCMSVDIQKNNLTLLYYPSSAFNY